MEEQRLRQLLKVCVAMAFPYWMSIKRTKDPVFPGLISNKRTGVWPCRCYLDTGVPRTVKSICMHSCPENWVVSASPQGGPLSESDDFSREASRDRSVGPPEMPPAGATEGGRPKESLLLAAARAKQNAPEQSKAQSCQKFPRRWCAADQGHALPAAYSDSLHKSYRKRASHSTGWQFLTGAKEQHGTREHGKTPLARTVQKSRSAWMAVCGKQRIAVCEPWPADKGNWKVQLAVGMNTWSPSQYHGTWTYPPSQNCSFCVWPAPLQLIVALSCCDSLLSQANPGEKLEKTNSGGKKRWKMMGHGSRGLWMSRCPAGPTRERGEHHEACAAGQRIRRVCLCATYITGPPNRGKRQTSQSMCAAGKDVMTLMKMIRIRNSPSLV
eukprot:scaffold54068_cov24-Tisochrysis_lutea.AAC.2